MVAPGVVAYADSGVGVVRVRVIGGLEAAPYVENSYASGTEVSASLDGMGSPTAGKGGDL